MVNVPGTDAASPAGRTTSWSGSTTCTRPGPTWARSSSTTCASTRARRWRRSWPPPASSRRRPTSSIPPTTTRPRSAICGTSWRSGHQRRAWRSLRAAGGIPGLGGPICRRNHRATPSALRIVLIEHPRQVELGAHERRGQHAPVQQPDDGLRRGRAHGGRPRGAGGRGTSGPARRPTPSWRRSRTSPPTWSALHAVYDWSDGAHVADLMAADPAGSRSGTRRALRLLPHLRGRVVAGHVAGGGGRGAGRARGDGGPGGGGSRRLGPAGRRDAARMRRALAAVPGLAVGSDGGVTADPRPAAGRGSGPAAHAVPHSGDDGATRGQHRRESRLLRRLHFLLHQPVLRRPVALAGAQPRERRGRDGGAARRTARQAALLLRRPQLLRPGAPRPAAGARSWPGC